MVCQRLPLRGTGESTVFTGELGGWHWLRSP